MQVLELVFFAALAAVVLFQLYTVLGRRVGRQAEDVADARRRSPGAERDARLLESAPDGVALSGLAALKSKDPSFDINKFLQGARSAYEMIVRAFASGDRNTLRGLTTPTVYQTFDRAIAAREAEGRTETVEFLQAPRADLESAEVAGDLARLKVRFLAEFRSRTKDKDGEAVDDRRTAEVWTFERPAVSRDPNWTLARVDAAEA